MPTYLSPGVYIQELDAATRPIEGVGTAVAAFVGFAPRGPQNTPTLVTNWTQYVDQFGDIETGSYLALAVYGYFLNGGGRCYIVRIGVDQPEPQGDGKQPKQVTASQTATIGNYVFTAKNATANAKAITVEIAPADGESPPDDEFKLTVNVDGKPPEVWGNVSSKPDSGNYVVNRVGGESKVVTVEAVLPDVQTKPKTGSVALAIPEPKSEPIVLDKRRVSASNYIGDSADRTGFSGLEEVEDVTMVCVPDLMAAYEQGAIDLETVKGVQLAIVAHCELMGDRMAILDPPPAMSVQDVAKWRTNDSGLDSKFAALYYPWIKVLDPVTGSTRIIPPSAHMAGIWARNDNERGVHKAPANEIVRGAIDVQTKITRIEQEALNPIGVNAVRGFPGTGHPRLGSPHPLERPGVAVHQRAAPLQLPREVHSPGDAVRGVRAERSSPVGQAQPHDHGLPDGRVARWRPLRSRARTGVLRTVRRRDEPGGLHRLRAGRLQDRGRAGQAGGVRHLPAVAVLGRQRLGRRVIARGIHTTTSPARSRSARWPSNSSTTHPRTTSA